MRGDLVVDPFAGAGTIPLEAALRGRRAFGADISPYSRILSKAKLLPPSTLDEAIRFAKRTLKSAEKLPKPDLRSVPSWVRKFFHPETLREALKFAAAARHEGNEFLMACFLGILHHQRPGFLSFPSSHLVPYLRDKKFPPAKYPEMYQYRELRPRLLAKIERSYKRFQLPANRHVSFIEAAVQSLNLPATFDVVITSPRSRAPSSKAVPRSSGSNPTCKKATAAISSPACKRSRRLSPRKQGTKASMA
jgi:hypothetical protein